MIIPPQFYNNKYENEIEMKMKMKMKMKNENENESLLIPAVQHVIFNFTHVSFVKVLYVRTLFWVIS